LRTLGSMPTSQEVFYQASRIVGVVAEDLCEFICEGIPIRETDVLDLVKRLDLAVELIREANGASN